MVLYTLDNRMPDTWFDDFTPRKSTEDIDIRQISQLTIALQNKIIKILKEESKKIGRPMCEKPTLCHMFFYTNSPQNLEPLYEKIQYLNPSVNMVLYKMLKCLEIFYLIFNNYKDGRISNDGILVSPKVDKELVKIIKIAKCAVDDKCIGKYTPSEVVGTDSFGTSKNRRQRSPKRSKKVKSSKR